MNLINFCNFTAFRHCVYVTPWKRVLKKLLVTQMLRNFPSFINRLTKCKENMNNDD
jgi:hypothetical protein